MARPFYPDITHSITIEDRSRDKSYVRYVKADVTLLDGERERRRSPGLSARQEALLDRWGYPFVLDEFRFHMTLTRRLDGGLRARIADSLERMTGCLIGREWCVDSISLCHQASREEPFTMKARFPLGQPER